MKGTILVTDSLFIFPEHEGQIRNAGYEIERLDTPKASEEELIQALQGKVGYILGGIEKVTDKVLASTDILKAIAFTGADRRNFVPGYQTAQQKGIKITNTPGANKFAVAEYTILAMLAMVRNLRELTRSGSTTFQTTQSLNEMTVGIIGMGYIGAEMVKRLQALGAKKITYFSRTRKPEIEQEYGIEFCDFTTVLKESDIVTLHASKEIGAGYISQPELALMKDNAILIDCGFTGGIDKDALFNELSAGRLRAFQDGPMDDRFDTLPHSIRQCSNSHTAFNTHQANKAASDMATTSMLNILAGNDDKYIVF